MKRSGKDSIADYLCRRHLFVKDKVAASLKIMVKSLFNMIDDQVEGDLKEVVDDRWGVTPRKIMQFMGTEVMQYKIQELLPDVGRTFWVKQMCNRLEHTKEMVVVSDVRFLHEVDELRHRFGDVVMVWKVTRSALESTDGHKSETEWRDIRADVVINNDGGLESLYAQVDTLVNTHINQKI